jgi:glutamate racemase
MIGLFDSGVGGLTVVKEMQRRLPNVQLTYFGDTARTPYGNKSAEVIEQYGLEAAKFLVGQGAQVLVVACNTVSALGLEAIKKAYPALPVFDVITPAVVSVIAHKVKRVGVMGTRALVGSGIYQRLLKTAPGVTVTASSAPLLVPLVEENWLGEPETKRIVKHYLMPFKQAQAQALVLACTHYPLLKKVITARLSSRVVVIDPAEATADALVEWLNQNPPVSKALSRGSSRFYVSDLTPQAQKIAQTWLGSSITLEKAHL